jgi:hypothetical protein
MSDCIELGIMQDIDPHIDYSYFDHPDDYKACLEKFHCISIPDDIVNEWIPLTQEMKIYRGSLEKEGVGIDHYGVTIIPPLSLENFKKIVISHTDNIGNNIISELIKLLDAAIEQNSYIICYGI